MSDELDTPAEGVHPDGVGLSGTANKGFPSTQGLTGGNQPVEYSNVEGEGAGEVDPAHAPVVRDERRGMFGAREGQDTSGYGGLRTSVAFPGAAQRPYGGWYDEVVDRLIPIMGDVTRAAARRRSPSSAGAMSARSTPTARSACSRSAAASAGWRMPPSRPPR